MPHHVAYVAGYVPSGGGFLIANNFMEFWNTYKNSPTLYVAPSSRPKLAVSVGALVRQFAYADSNVSVSLGGWSMDEARTLSDLINFAIKDLSPKPQRATNCYPYSGGKEMLLICVKG